MKMKPEHFAHLLAAISAAQAAHPELTRQVYIDRKIGKDHAMRHRWDLLYAAKLTPWVCDTLYKNGLNDTHIDTALRAIVSQIEASNT